MGTCIGNSPRLLSFGSRRFEQAPGVDRPSFALCYATSGSLSATQGQR
jgi:hypothetical protein